MTLPLLIINRKAATRTDVDAAVTGAREAGAEFDVRVPWDAADSAALIRDELERGRRRVIAGGGDGTLNAVANLILSSAQSDTAEIGFMPLGTANDLAHGLGLPCDDLQTCLVRAATEDARPMDVGVMNDQYFINVASGGFGAEITASTPNDMKAQLGGLAYSLVGLSRLWQLEPYRGVLHIPGQDSMEGGMLLLAVGNSRLAGGGFEVAPKARADDGLLDLAVLLEGALSAPAQAIAELKQPLAEDNELMRYLQLPAFTIEAERPLHINLDGEPVLSDRLDFSVRAGALRAVF